MSDRDVKDLTIKLVDGAGRTVCAFVKRLYLENGEWNGDDWGVALKPASEKVRMHPDRPRPADQDSSERYLKQQADGRRVFEIPGLWLRWEKVAPVLDRLAESGIQQLTVAQFRECIR
jgi:hypothetical protein